MGWDGNIQYSGLVWIVNIMTTTTTTMMLMKELIQGYLTTLD